MCWQSFEGRGSVPGIFKRVSILLSGTTGSDNEWKCTFSIDYWDYGLIYQNVELANGAGRISITVHYTSVDSMTAMAYIGLLRIQLYKSHIFHQKKVSMTC